MFEQHPVPQNISSYQFRLIGDMTIKQFMQLAGGGVVALLFYSSPFPAFIKWPLVVISAISGAALAFFPIMDRPLDKWVFAFVRAIYSPTIFVWQKQPAKNYFKAEEANRSAVTQQATQSAPAQPAQQQAQAQQTQAQQVSSKHTGGGVFSALEEAERAFLHNITNLFGSHHQKENKPEQAAHMSMNVHTPGVGKSSPTQPQVQNQSVGLPEAQQIKATGAAVREQAVAIPKTGAVKVEAQNPQLQVQQQSSPATSYTPTPTLAEQKQKVEQVAQFSDAAAPPGPPERANIIVGQVIAPDGGIVEGAILEIIDEFGRPVRALRSNKAGHFSIVTPLNEGTYTIKVESERYSFNPISFTANGAIIPPIRIQAKV